MGRMRVGVVGVGYLGQFHAEKYAMLPDIELTGVVDPDRAKAEAVAGKLGSRAHATIEGLIGSVDAVSIVTPTVHHHAVAKRFLEAGIPVLLEKPITVTLEQADDLIALASRKRVLLQIGHIERFNPAVTAVKQRLTGPRYLQAERSAPFTARCTDVNVVLDLMIHDLDIVMDLAGSRPREISAAGASVITREIDSAMARIVFENGAVADVSASRVSDEKKRILRVFDASGLFVADYQTQKASVHRPGPGQVPLLASEEIPTERRDTLYEEIREFVRCVRDGSRPLVTGAEGRRALALAQAVSRSIEQGAAGFVPAPERGA